MNRYYTQEGKKLKGPYTVEELAEMNIHFNLRLCQQGTNEWKVITEIPDYEKLRLFIKPDIESRKIELFAVRNIWLALLFLGIGMATGKFLIPDFAEIQQAFSNKNASIQNDTLHSDSSQIKLEPVALLDVNEYANDFAYLISGVTPKKIEDQLNENANWVQLASSISEEWDRVLQEKILPINEWRSENKEMAADSGTLFYPFAGADFLYSNCFFPNCNKVIMVGLEPLGSIPKEIEFNNDIEQLARKIKTSLYTSNRLGYFMTISMAKELHHHDLNGVLPLILFYACRQNYLISDYQYVKMGQDGKTVACEYDEADGFVLTLTDTDRIKKKTIEYYRTDLSNGGFNIDSSFHRYFTSIHNKMVFLKAASYLLHESAFSNIRDVILDNTRMLLQDDSGMPFKFLNTDAWNTHLYGKYTRPIGLFSGRVQSELRAEFANRSFRDLPFNIGYNVSHNEPHLILAIKK